MGALAKTARAAVKVGLLRAGLKPASTPARYGSMANEEERGVVECD